MRGLKIKDISAWRYEDTLLSDRRRRENLGPMQKASFQPYANCWTKDNIERSYVYMFYLTGRAIELPETDNN